MKPATGSKSSKKSQSSKRGKSRGGRRGKAQTSGFSAAPAAVSDFLLQTVSFQPSNGGRGLRMRVCAPLRSVGASGVSGDTSALKLPGTSTQSYVSSWNPVNSVIVTNAETPAISTAPWLNPVWELIASAFVRYRIMKMEYKYLPQSAATLSDQLVFAFANDPMHPVIGVAAAASGLNNQQLLGLADSVPFMPWREWSLDVTESFISDQPFYVARQPAAPVDFNGLEVTRFSEAGIFALTCSGTASTSITYGVLYGCIDIELLEFCPILPYNLSTASLATRTCEVKSKRPTEEDHCAKETTAEVTPVLDEEASLAWLRSIRSRQQRISSSTQVPSEADGCASRKTGQGTSY